MRLTGLLALVIGLFAASCSDTPVDNGATSSHFDKTAKEKFSADLSGDAERPVPVTTEASGRATFKLSKDGTELEYKLMVHDMDNITASHIHMIVTGETGGVVAFLYSGTPGDEVNGTLVHGTIDASDLVGALAGMTMDDLMAAIDAGTAYVNVHSTEYPAGEIRGTIVAE